MSSEQEFDEGFQEDVAQDESAGEAAPADDQATDADFTDEDWSDADEAAEGEGGSGEGEPDQKAAKKKKMNMMLLGGAVVVGLGVAYMTMHKKIIPVPPPTNVPVPVTEPTQTDMVYADANRDKDSDKADKKKKVDKSGFLTDPNLIKKAQKLSDSHVPSEDETLPESVARPAMPAHDKPPQPAPIKQVDVDEDNNQPLTPMPQEVAGNVVKPEGTAPTNTTPSQPDQATSASNPKPETAATTPTTATAPAMNATNHAGTATTTSPTTPALNATTSSAASTGTSIAAPTMSGTQLESIASKLDGIENHIKTLEESVVHRDELADIHAQIDALSKRMDSLTASGVKAAPVHANANAEHTGSHAAKSHHATSRHTVSASKSPSVHPNVWMLKSAMPGMAMIAGSDGQMMTIKPGDRVVGLGRIRSIAEKNGRWVVTGTTGSVHQ